MSDRPQRSVRARITAVAAVAVTAVLLVAGTLLVLTQQAGLRDQLDEAVEIDAERLAASAAAGDVPTPDDDDDRVVAVMVDGEVVAVTGDLDGDVLDDLVGGGDGSVTIDGERHRVASAEEGRVRVVVAAPTEDIDETIGNLVRTLAAVVVAATAILAAVVWTLVGRTLRPVEQIRAEVDVIGLDQLDRRVPQPEGTDEIARLATTMNAMLDRLDEANQRQQRFVADASHELRTPLTRMRAELELAERELADGGAGLGDAGRRSLFQEVVTMQHLVSDLLLLARGEASNVHAGRLVDLDDLVIEEARSAAAVEVFQVSAAQVRGDPAALRQVVRNLLDNALRHAKSTCVVSLSEKSGTARLVIEDDGPGVPVDRRAEVFERFSRLDEARTPTEGRSGLGLAIVHAIVTRHGGTVTIDDSPLGGARLIVTLPATAPSSPSSPSSPGTSLA